MLKKMDDYYIPPEDIQNIHKMKNSKISSLYELCNKYDITYETPITKSDLYEKIKLYINNKYFDSYEQENCNDIDLISVGININIKFDEFLKHHDDIQYIIIERFIKHSSLSCQTCKIPCLLGVVDPIWEPL